MGKIFYWGEQYWQNNNHEFIIIHISGMLMTNAVMDLSGTKQPKIVTVCIEYLHLQMFSLYDINNRIDIQFCMKTFDDVI